jgi:hypothetical protein
MGGGEEEEEGYKYILFFCQLYCLYSTYWYKIYLYFFTLVIFQNNNNIDSIINFIDELNS